MAIAPQPAMPQPAVTTRPQPAANLAGTTRHTVLSPVPVPRVGLVALRLASLMVATAFVVGGIGAIVLAVVTGALHQVG
jgi:hypothetical protein